jgi:ketosteroid isomerase-like protein
MSEENVQLHRQGLDAFNRRDLDAFVALADPAVELIPFNLEMEGGVYRGHEGVRSFFADYLAVFPDFTAEADEVRDLGDLTLARGRLLGHGSKSDASFEQRIWQVCRWRDYKCIWWRSFRNEKEALEAAGLSE